MKKEYCIPACYKYIKKKDGTVNSERIFSVAKAAYQAKYPDQKIDDNDFFRFLQMNQIIDQEIKIGDIDTEHVELCFTIISQYKCNSICQLCGYSPLFKNQFEAQEAILIGYALSNWEHLQNLVKSGLTSRHFRSMIPVTDKSAVTVVPINRLAFEYMEKIPKSQEDMLSITDNIIAVLKQNNKSKLYSADFNIIKKYLDNLYNSDYRYLKEEKIAEILKTCFQLTYHSAIKNDNTNSQPPQPVHNHTGGKYLEGFLTGKPSVISGNRNLKQETPGKKFISEKENKKAAQNVDAKKVSMPQTSNPKTTNSQKGLEKLQRKQEPIVSIPKSNEALLSSYTKKNPDEMPEKDSDNILGRKPIIWKLTQEELSEYVLINLDNADSLQMNCFLNKLLMSPLLPMEILIDNTQTEWVLIYAGDSFYSYTKSNLTILDTILPYIQKSNFRKIICYEPYEIYAYFHQQQVYGISLFSLRLAMDYTYPADYWKKDSQLALQEICHTQNPNRAPVLIDNMRNYHQAYQKLEYRLKKLNKGLMDLYQDKIYISRLLGYSYYMNLYCNTQDRLFVSEEIDGYVFSYSEKDKMNFPYLSVQFRIYFDDGIFPVENLLTQIMKNKVPEFHNIALLSYSKENVIFAAKYTEYNYLCDLINNLTCYYSQIENKLPVHIDETILGGSME